MGAANPFRYKGYYYDSETGLYSITLPGQETRYYDPETGRFISPCDVSQLNPFAIDGINMYTYNGNNPVANSGLSHGGNSFSYNYSGTGIGGNSHVGNPNAQDWLQAAIGAIPDFILGAKYLLSHGMHSNFAYATNTRYMQPIMGGTWRWTAQSGSALSDFGNLIQGNFRQILTGDSKAGFGAIAKSFGFVVAINGLINFGFNLYENNWQVDSAMLKDTGIDTAIGVGSYYLAAGTMSLIAAGVVMAGFALPGIVVVGGIVLLSIGFEWAIREITGYKQ